MSFRQSRGYKILLYALTVACLGGAGYLAYRTFFVSPSLESFVKAAEASYEKGVKAYEAKNWGEASLKFDEARVLTDKAMEALDNQIKEQTIPPEDINPLRAKILWLRARAVRDHAFAKGHAEGKPIPDSVDPQYKNEVYRSYTAIPDDEARNEAVGALLTSVSLNSDGDILKEALRVELVQNPIQWSRTEPLLRKAIERDPRDARARLYLARYEFDQPQANGAPTPLARKEADRVEAARTHLAVAREAGSQYWRSVGLEAEILSWAVQTARTRVQKSAASGTDSKALAAAEKALADAEKPLDKLLFDPQSGAVAAAGKGEKLAGMGLADARGLTAVLTIGLGRAVEEARKPGNKLDWLREVTRAALDLATKIEADPAYKAQVPEVMAGLSAVAVGAQPLLAPSDPGWREYITNVETVLAKSEVAKTRPSVSLQLAQIAFQDAALAERSGDTARAKELVALGMKRSEEGLEAAVKANVSPLELAEYHSLLAQRKLASGARAETIEPHLAKLREIDSPRIKAIASFVEARLAERQGKLDKARKLLQPLAADKSNADLAFQASVLLAGINIATRDSKAALLALVDVERGYQKAAELDQMSRAFADTVLGGPDGVLLLQLIANLQEILKAADQYRASNPGQPIPYEQIAAKEDAARKLLDRLRRNTLHHRVGQLRFADYELATSRLQPAKERVKELSTLYPTSIEVLRMRCLVEALPSERTASPVAFTPEGLKISDALIDDYIANFPTERKAGRLFKAEWLVRSNRAAEAVEYLKNPNNFPTGRDAAVERVLAVALDRAGQKEEARKILSQLPHDPALDADLIRGTVDRESRDQQLKAALERYENQGTFRLQEAVLNLSEGKYEDAIRGFTSALEFTNAAETAKLGLVQSLVAYAFQDPLKAREAAIKLIAENPNVAMFYLPAADASLILDDVGTPADNWDQTKTAYAAMNRWRDVATKSGTKPIELSLTRARFHSLAGNPDQAKTEAAQIVRSEEGRRNIPALLLLTELYMAPPVNLETARAYLDAVVRENAQVGLQYLIAGPWRDYASAVIQQSARYSQVPYLDARLRELTGDRAGAIAVYEKLVNANPRNPIANGFLIPALTAAGRDADALARAQAWLAAAPDDGRALIHVIRLLTLSGKKAEAVKLADDFVTAQTAEVRKRIGEANPPLTPEAAAKTLEAARMNCVFTGAVGFYQAKAYDECRTRLDEILKARPTDTTVLQLKGDMALHLKDWDGAIAAYSALLKLRPRDFIAGNNIAYVLADNKNDPAAALTFIEEVRKGRGALKPIAPERLPADFLDTIGVVYTKLNRADKYPEMLGIFEAATRRYNADPRMYLYLATALEALNDRAKALESLDTAVRLAGVKNNGITEDQNKKVIEAAEAARKRIRG